jgi:hypothetical protein
MTTTSKPRRTREVIEGWEEIRALITCLLENGQESQFECAHRSEEAEPDSGACQCEGCKASRAAWKAIAWIDARL